MFRVRTHLLALTLLLFCTPFLHADIIILKNGRTIEGIAEERDDQVHVRLRFGKLTLPRDQVVEIQREKTRDEEYFDRLSRTDLGEPLELRRLISWCRRNDLEERANELDELLRGVVLEEKIRELDPADPEPWYQLAIWSRVNNHSVEVYKYLLKKTLEADPNYVDARYALGQRRYKGEWLTVQEIERRKEEELARKMAEKGLIRYKGEWVRPQDAEFVDEAKRLARKEEELKEELVRVDSLKETLDDELEAFRRERKRLRDEREKISELRQKLRKERKRKRRAERHIYRPGRVFFFRRLRKNCKRR